MRKARLGKRADHGSSSVSNWNFPHRRITVKPKSSGFGNGLLRPEISTLPDRAFAKRKPTNVFHEALAAAIASACPRTIAATRTKLWSAIAAGMLTDDQADALNSAIEARHPTAPANEFKPKPNQRRVSIFPTRPPVRRPSPKESVRRRRRTAQGPMPAHMCVSFTTGELAVLAIIAEEVRAHGRCDRSLAEIAARAGVCRSLVQRAIRVAAGFGLLVSQKRPMRGRKSMTNLVTIISVEWLAWLTSPTTTGSTNVSPTKSQNHKKGERPAATSLAGRKGRLQTPTYTSRRASR